MAAFLIAALSFLTVAAPCASLHQQLHGDHHGTSDTCVLCMMAQGHMDCPMAAPPHDFSALVCVGFTSAHVSVRPLPVDLRLSPSRGPPCC